MDHILGQRRAWLAFWLGCIAVTVGTVLHLPMFLMARDSGYVLAGMTMDDGMLAGMAIIVLGVALTCYGLAPGARDAEAAKALLVICHDDKAALTRPHWLLMTVLTVALVVDVMKPASLGLVLPGMRAEYGVSNAEVAWLPFSALTGTFVGSVLFGILADHYGRRAAILISSIMFVGTSICGAMPDFWWNVFMCFMMGAAAGGMLPVTYALLAETIPTRYRGVCLVVVGALGAAGGYLAASGLSALLQPMFGWRIMWFLNLPTGLLLILISGFIPESAKFLLQTGRFAAARTVLERFGASVHVLRPADERGDDEIAAPPPPQPPGYALKLLPLSVAALTWSVANFGILLWLPAELAQRGFTIAAASRLLAQSAIIAIPTAVLAAVFYCRISTKWTLVGAMGLTACGMALLVLLEHPLPGLAMTPIWPVAVVVFGSNAMLAVLLPYTAELFPARVRGRATGWVAGCTKCGGVFAQAVGIANLIPRLADAALFIIVLLAGAILLVARYGEETRRRDLDRLDGVAEPVSSES